jgi:hypothetical protein
MRLDAIVVTADSIVTLAPAPGRRAWMDRTPERFANRCLPLLMANQAGWMVNLTEPVEVEWSGREGHGEVEVFGSARVQGSVKSHFGSASSPSRCPSCSAPAPVTTSSPAARPTSPRTASPRSRASSRRTGPLPPSP